MSEIAAVDLGSNSFRLQMARVEGDQLFMHDSLRDMVRLGAGLIEKTAELVLLGWVNKLGGIILYMALYTVMLSVLLFYAEKINVISAATIASSQTYPFIQPWGPKTINAIGSLIPVFKDMFLQLENFFAGISGKIQPR